MAVITVAPLVMKDVLFQIASDSYQKAITSVTLTPSAQVISQAAVSPGAVYSDVGPTTWTCELAFLQDWATAGSLCKYLFDNEGETVSVTFEPIAGGATITVSLVITPGAIGGDVGAFGVAQVSLPVVGKPSIGA